MVGLTAALVLCAAISAIAGYLQWQSISGQLDEMKSSGNQIERQLMLSTAQLIVANRAAGSAQRQADAAQQSVKAVQRQMWIDQRPWLFVPVSSAKPEVFDLGKDIADEIFIVNSGKTLARNVVTTFRVHMLLTGEELKFDYSNHFFPPIISNMGTIFPNEAPRSLRLAVVTMKGGKKVTVRLPKRDFDLLANNGEHAIYGIIKYDDMFGHHHWIHYCGGVIPVTAFPNAPSKSCVEYNDADHND